MGSAEGKSTPRPAMRHRAGVFVIPSAAGDAAYYATVDPFGERAYGDGRGCCGHTWYDLGRGDGHNFIAQGNYGQYICVSNDKDLIIVRNGERFGIDGFDWMAMFHDFVSAMADAS
jgi:CubicO group peptidase (beta-lactamase class C family)